MAPPVPTFGPAELEALVQYDLKGRYRKERVELRKCKLLELVQYSCNVENREDPRGRVKCVPLLRLFRRCANGLTVETTAWEEMKSRW